MRGARCFFSQEKQVFLVGFSLKFPRFPRISKNRLNTSLVNGKITKPKLITTHMAENTIKAALKQKYTSLLVVIKDLNLTPKEFKYHERYYKEFTFGFSETFREPGQSTASKNINENNCESNVGDLDAVIAYINIKVLDENQTVSMSTLHSMCGLNVGNNRYRGKRKTSSYLNW